MEESIVKEYILDNSERFLTELNRFRRLMFEEINDNIKSGRSCFNDDIRNEYNQKASHHIMDDVTKNLQVSAEDAMIVIEELILGGLLR